MAGFPLIGYEKDKVFTGDVLDCDLSETGIFDSVGYGLNRYTYNIDYRIKTSGKLENKGKVKQAAAELIHQHSNSAKAKFTGKILFLITIQSEPYY